MSSANAKPAPETDLEQDDRFPSGPWKGFFLQPMIVVKSWMELILTFQQGKVRGEGRDWVGKFLISGTYDINTGKCFWDKAYIGKHSLIYQGYNEGKGIWGMWEFEAAWKGGFHIWPEAMGDPTQQRLTAELEASAPFDLIAIETNSSDVLVTTGAG